jgi:uncharacterized protein YkwD
MSNAHHSHNKNFWILSVSFLFIILIGIIISIIQIRNKNTIETKAEIATSAIVNCQTTANDASISSEEKKLFDQINSYRQQQGVGKLDWSVDLIRSATWMSNDMLTNNYLSHTDSSGRGINTRIENCGYLGAASFGEVVDSGTQDASSIFQTWQHSPAQNNNMLNPNYKEAGIALATNPVNNSYYWTLNLGVKTPPTPTSIPSPTLTATSVPTLIPTSILLSPTAIKISSPTPKLFPTSTPGVIATSKPRPTSPFTPTSTPLPTKMLTPTPVPGFVAKPDDTQVYASIKLVGIGKGGNARPKHLSRHAQVEIFDLTNKSVALGNGDLSYDGHDLFRGIIHLGKIDNGKYYIKIVGDNTLIRIVKPQFIVLNNTELNILPSVSMIQGDTNVDNIIDINDYNAVLPCFQNIKCQYRDLIDFNDDGATNAIDYNLLLFNFWKAQGD